LAGRESLVLLYFGLPAPATDIKVAFALNYAKAATFVANKDLTLLAIFEKMFPFIFFLKFTHIYDLYCKYNYSRRNHYIPIINLIGGSG